MIHVGHEVVTDLFKGNETHFTSLMKRQMGLFLIWKLLPSKSLHNIKCFIFYFNKIISKKCLLRKKNLYLKSEKKFEKRLIEVEK